jgi:hypothetical protein
LQPGRDAVSHEHRRGVDMTAHPPGGRTGRGQQRDLLSDRYAQSGPDDHVTLPGRRLPGDQ